MDIVTGKYVLKFMLHLELHETFALHKSLVVATWFRSVCKLVIELRSCIAVGFISNNLSVSSPLIRIEESARSFSSALMPLAISKVCRHRGSGEGIIDVRTYPYPFSA